MQLLEKVPQDIKAGRDYTPCAPEFFRWVVIGGYLLVLLSAVVWGLFVLKERQRNSMQIKDKQRLQEIIAQINAVKAKDDESQALRTRYMQWYAWLRGNYSLSKYLGKLFETLPEGSRLQELDLRDAQTRPGAFTLKMRFFAQGENRMTDTQDFEEKLTGLGVDIQNRQQSVTEGGKTEIDTTVQLPKAYYPAALKGGNDAEIEAAENAQAQKDAAKEEEGK